MASSHTVQQGDHISSIALQYGFGTWDLIWNHANNASLKEKRKNPNVLFPGDVLYIPDKNLGNVPCATTKIHNFQVNVPLLKLRIVVRNRAGKPVPNALCELEIDGEKQNLTTNGSGLVEKYIEATATGGTFKVPSLQFEAPVQIGHLDPVDEDPGLVGRLRNLGYYVGDLEDVNADRLQSAIEEFQCDFGLKVDGDPGAQTQAKLKEIHGC